MATANKSLSKLETDNETKVARTSVSSAHPHRFTQDEVIDAIKASKSKPLLVAEGKAIDLASEVRRFGNKEISIVVLS